MFQGMEYVYAVYQERSFSRAAEKLFVSQPSLSACVKRVEQRIGYPIFDRSTKPLGLTECGQHYIWAVEQIMSVEGGFSEFISDFGGLKSGKLILGGSSFFSSWVLPPLIGTFSRAYPMVKTTLVEENTAALERSLQSGSVDFVMDNCKLDDAVFDSYCFQEEHLLLAVPRSFAVNGALKAFQIPAETIKSRAFLTENIPPVPLGAFSAEPFIFMKPENDTAKRAAAICQEGGLRPQVLFELDQQMTAYNVTCSGMGISFIGDMLISRVPANPDVVYYNLSGPDSLRHIYVYWKRGRYFSRAMQEFLRLVSGDGGKQ